MRFALFSCGFCDTFESLQLAGFPLKKNPHMGKRIFIPLKVKSVLLKQKIVSGFSGWSEKGIAPSA
jgi:hypothetical protein